MFALADACSGLTSMKSLATLKLGVCNGVTVHYGVVADQIDGRGLDGTLEISRAYCVGKPKRDSPLRLSLYIYCLSVVSTFDRAPQASLDLIEQTGVDFAETEMRDGACSHVAPRKGRALEGVAT